MARGKCITHLPYTLRKKNHPHGFVAKPSTRKDATVQNANSHPPRSGSNVSRGGSHVMGVHRLFFLSGACSVLGPRMGMQDGLTVVIQKCAGPLDLMKPDPSTFLLKMNAFSKDESDTNACRLLGPHEVGLPHPRQSRHHLGRRVRERACPGTLAGIPCASMSPACHLADFWEF
eukprot:772327-Pelagomonas_calceolata.AAC.1